MTEARTLFSGTLILYDLQPELRTKQIASNR